MNFEKIGGIASIVIVFLSVFLMVSVLILFPRLGIDFPSDIADPIKHMAAWEEYQYEKKWPCPHHNEGAILLN